ncbi:unnamed protein product [Penicillium nalgiovense]|uniref:SMP-30/Gluconolactonase/LRE-like region domain-containing protein n=1 Tax=Penicillium nalgiovense TaxID=60175 RepID=A0A1V6Y709_PENNA|nr:hypothetical protein PENNAL_c0034G10715 [Penicillium nalgiovense]CAG7935033.1 unnamed protein product [Penicillium nalgiovense]CAG7937416.1 unnamed protein product [Penicillium nalgiovense]CAG7937532.1 unnamed protein product [Penicillium nalgiovense]CAG7942707.1 unnamed protein product [Penicillium nalgiovense]
MATGILSQRAGLWALIVLAISILYRSYVHNIIFVTIGIGREIQSIDEFPWTCTRLQHPLLEGCEDMWLDDQGRKLYAVCNSVESRQGWCPGGGKYNISARSRTDHIAVLDIDEPGPDGLYGLHQLKVGGYDDDLDLIAFDVRRIDGRLRFWLINHRPPVDPTTGEFLDAFAVGANSTIEIFDLDDASETLEYVKTIVSESIISPNSLAVDNDGLGFVITNDHNAKVGTFIELEFLIGGGSLTYCRSDTGKCHVAANKGFSFANGIVQENGLYYVAHSVTGLVTVHKLVGDQLVQVDKIHTGLPLDNLSLDADGNLLAAAIPDSITFVKSIENPYELVAPATVLTVNGIATQLRTHDGKGCEVSKLVEDRDAKWLPSSTVAVKDVKSHRLFLGGVVSPFITVCEQHI